MYSNIIKTKNIIIKTLYNSQAFQIQNCLNDSFADVMLKTSDHMYSMSDGLVT